MTYDHVTPYMHKARLGVLLERKGMSRKELAKLLDASPKTIKAIESGKYDPPLSMAYKLAAALDVPVERLFSD